MTNGEAVKNLKILEKRWTEDEDMFSPTITIEIDEEFMQSIYKAISALEKQIPKKAANRLTGGEFRYKVHDCPNCGQHFGFRNDVNYCENCGQKIDWSEVSE